MRCANAGVFRYEPRTQKFDVYVTYRLRQPARPRLRPLGPGHRRRRHRRQPVPRAPCSPATSTIPHKHARPPQVYQQRTRPCPGIEYPLQPALPRPRSQGNLLVANVIGFQGILQYKIERQRLQLRGHRARADPLVDRPELPPVRPARSARTARSTSSTGRTRSSATCSTTSATRAATATHGRIYRVTYEGRPLLKPAEDRRRADREAARPAQGAGGPRPLPRPHRAGRPRHRRGHRRRRRSGSPASTRRTPDYEHHLLEALWLHQYHNVVNADLLKRMLASPDFRARAAATRVLCYWRDRVPDALDLLKKLAADAHPRVRLEAVRAASFFTRAGGHRDRPDRRRACRRDNYLDFVRGETMKALDPLVKKAIADGQADPASRRRPAPASSSRTSRTDDLLKMKRTPAVYLELLFRTGRPRRVPPRGAGRPGQAARSKAELRVLLDAIRTHDEQQDSAGRERRLRPGPPADRPARRN